MQKKEMDEKTRTIAIMGAILTGPMIPGQILHIESVVADAIELYDEAEDQLREREKRFEAGMGSQKD